MNAIRAGLLVIALCFGHASASDLIMPNPAQTARQVLTVQLDALQGPEEVETMVGIRQVWLFAHPQNRRVTGPLERFSQMLGSSAYRALLSHMSYEIEKINVSDMAAVYAVRVLAQNGGYYQFRWRLEKADIAAGRCWMTTRVSPAKTTGKKLS